MGHSRACWFGEAIGQHWGLIETGDSNATLAVLKEAESLAQKVDEGRHADHVRSLLGILHGNVGTQYILEAHRYHAKALAVAQATLASSASVHHSADLALVPHLSGLAGAWMRIGDFDAAEEAYMRAKPIVENSGDYYRMSELYGNIGSMFYILRDYPEAWKWYEKARSTSRLCGDAQSGGAHALNP